MGQICWFISFLDQMRIISLTVILTLVQSRKHWQDRAKCFSAGDDWFQQPSWPEKFPKISTMVERKDRCMLVFPWKHCIELSPFSCQDNRTVTDCAITVIWLDKRMYMDRNNTRVSYLIICENYNQLFQEFVCVFFLLVCRTSQRVNSLKNDENVEVSAVCVCACWVTARLYHQVNPTDISDISSLVFTVS